MRKHEQKSDLLRNSDVYTSVLVTSMFVKCGQKDDKRTHSMSFWYRYNMAGNPNNEEPIDWENCMQMLPLTEEEKAKVMYDNCEYKNSLWHQFYDCRWCGNFYHWLKQCKPKKKRHKCEYSKFRPKNTRKSVIEHTYEEVDTSTQTARSEQLRY